MLNLGFILSSFGIKISQDEITKIQSMLAPEKISAVLNELHVRFEAMEARNIEMHAAILEMRDKALMLPRAGNPIDAEHARQVALNPPQFLTYHDIMTNGENPHDGDYQNGDGQSGDGRSANGSAADH